MTYGDELDKLNERMALGLPTKTKLINYRKSGEPFLNDFTVVPVFDWLADDNQLINVPEFGFVDLYLVVKAQVVTQTTLLNISIISSLY